MTLNLLIARPDGLWLSCDFRLSDLKQGRWVPRKDHWSPKYFSVNAAGGARMAMTYTGVGEVSAIEPDLQTMVGPDAGALQLAPGKRRTVSVTEWLSWVLAGETRSAEEVVEHIGVEAAKLREFRLTPHVFSGIVHTPYDGCWVFELSNIDIREGELGGGKLNSRCFYRRPLPTFNAKWVSVQGADSSFAGAIGSGAGALREADFKQLTRAARVRPRKPKDYEGLLAEINRRVAGREATVSPACQTLYLNPNFEAESNEAAFGGQLWENGQKVPEDFDGHIFWMNLFGLDMSLITREFTQRALAERDAYMARKAEEGERPDPPT